MTNKEINKRLEEELDKQFPKGDKARGRALVLFAIAQIELEKAKQDEIKMINNTLLNSELGYRNFEQRYDGIKEELNKRLQELKG